jgi:hypothetical protein
MFFYIWLFITLGLGITFLYVCYLAAKYLKQHLGWGVALFFVFGLLSFGGLKQKSPLHVLNIDFKERYTDKESLDMNLSQSTNIIIDHTPVADFNLSVMSCQNKNTLHYVPVSAMAGIQGLPAGTDWNPLTIDLHPTGMANQFLYRIDAVKELNIFGIYLKRELKSYEGLITLP